MFQIKILLALCVLLALNPLHAFAQIPEEPCYEEDDLYEQEEDTYENEENPCEEKRTTAEQTDYTYRQSNYRRASHLDHNTSSTKVDIDLKAIQRRSEHDTYGGIKPYRMGQTPKEYAQDYVDNPQDYVQPPAPETAIAPKYEGDWFTPVYRQNLANDWLGSKFKYAPLLLQGGDGNAPIIKKEELQKRYGDALGFNFSRDMSEARAKIIADDYKQQVEDARIASNFSGNDNWNKVRFSAPTILAHLPNAIIFVLVAWFALAVATDRTQFLRLGTLFKKS